MLRHSNLDAERSVLGAILIDNNVLGAVTDILDSTDFYNTKNRRLFERMYKLQTVDFITLTDSLRVDGSLDDIGLDYISDLCEQVVTSVGVERYAKIVKDLSTRRTHIQSMNNQIEDLQEGSDLDELPEFYSRMADGLNDHVKHGWDKLGKGYSQIYDRISNVIDGKESFGIPTGFTRLDKVTGGAKPGELWVFGACSSHGKTTAVTQIAINAAKTGKYVGFFSFEMNRETLLMYHASREAGLEYNDVINGNITHQQNALFLNEMGKLNKLDIDVYESSALTTDRLVSVGTQKNFDLVIIDYLQRFSQRKSQQLRETITNGAKAAKTLAKELKSPVFLVSSITKEVGNRVASRAGAPGWEGMRGIPTKSDLKESGDIEYEADNVVLLTIPSKSGNDCSLDLGYWFLVKQRTGATAYMQMTWDVNKWENF